MGWRFQFSLRNALTAMTLAAFWCALAVNGPADPNALSHLVMVVLPVAAAFAMFGRMWLGMLVGCGLVLILPVVH
jgi:hypothetical protein